MALNPQVKKYPYLMCRGPLRHAWFEVPSDWTPEFGVPFTARCERCGMERRLAFNRNTGDLEYRRYVQPIGYAFHKNGAELPTSSDFRLAWLEGHVTELRKQRAERAAKQKERIGR